jgi:hypothetical protein
MRHVRMLVLILCACFVSVAWSQQPAGSCSTIQATVDLVKALVWPAVVVTAVLLFRTEIKSLAGRGKIIFRWGDV